MFVKKSTSNNQVFVINVTNTCEKIVRGKTDVAFCLGQETLQISFRI